MPKNRRKNKPKRGPTPPKRRGAAGRVIGDSFLEAEGASFEGVRAFFEAWNGFVAAAPWRVAELQDLIHVQAPAIEAEALCVVVVGDVEPGLFISPTYDDYEAFLEFAFYGNRDLDEYTEASVPRRLICKVRPKVQLPRYLQAEITKNGLPLASPKAAPHVVSERLDGKVDPLTARELAVLTSLLRAIPDFVSKERALFEEGEGALARTGYDAPEHGLALTVSAPYLEAFADQVRQQAPRPSPIEDRPELAALTSDITEAFLAMFPDEPHHALGGESPLEAVVTARGRRRVAAILEHVAAKRERGSAGPIDLGPLRQRLGLE